MCRRRGRATISSKPKTGDVMSAGPLTGCITRRRFLREAGIAGTAALELSSNPARAAVRGHRRPAGATVAVLGGGVAGLTVAHELAERGFQVNVYERKALGGKARSIPAPGPTVGGRLPLPGEHGYRVCVGSYQYLPDTMRRIPIGGGRSVYDNLVKGGDILLAQSDGRHAYRTFLMGPPSLTLDQLPDQLLGAGEFASRVPADELAFWARQVLIYLTSCDERRFGQWENVSMWDYMRAGGKSAEYQLLFTDMCSHLVQSTPSRLASARAHMNLWEAIVYCAAGQGDDGRPVAELLNAPTNQAWIDPWIRHLSELGTCFHIGQTVEALNMRRGRIVSARVRDQHGRRRIVEADYFVCAVRARQLMTAPLLAADPRLEAIHQIPTRWMNGIQFYLRRPVAINHGHVFCIESPWVVSSISQAQFWPVDFAGTYGDGQVQDCLSAVASEWDTPGILYGKPARDCTPEQIAREVWAQMQAGLDDTGHSYLPDEVLHSWFLDPAIRYRQAPDGTRSDEPLFIQTPGLWPQRPQPATAVTNLFLAADYVRNPAPIDTASMDGATAAAHTAVNALLDTSGSRATRAAIYDRYTAPEFRATKQLDAERYKLRQPHILDTPWPEHPAPNELDQLFRQLVHAALQA